MTVIVIYESLIYRLQTIVGNTADLLSNIWQKKDHLHLHLSQLEQKTLAQTKAKALPKQNTSKTSIPLEPRVVIQPVISTDQQEDQEHSIHQINQINYLIFPQNNQSTYPILLQTQQTLQTLHQIYQVSHNNQCNWKIPPCTSFKLVLL